MLGFEQDEIGDTLSEWETRVHPEDKPAVMAEIEKHFAGATPVYISEHRLLCKDGTWKWILDRGKVCERTATTNRFGLSELIPISLIRSRLSSSCSAPCPSSAPRWNPPPMVFWSWTTTAK